MVGLIIEDLQNLFKPVIDVFNFIMSIINKIIDGINGIINIFSSIINLVISITRLLPNPLYPAFLTFVSLYVVIFTYKLIRKG